MRKREIINLEESVVLIKQLAESKGICNDYECAFYFASILGERNGRLFLNVPYKEKMETLLIIKQLADNAPIKIGTCKKLTEGEIYNIVKNAIRDALLDNDVRFNVEWNLKENIDWENPKQIEDAISKMNPDLFKPEKELSVKSPYSAKPDIEGIIKALSLPYYLQKKDSKKRKMLPVDWVAFIYDLLSMPIYHYYTERADKQDKYNSIKRFCTIDKSITAEYAKNEIKEKAKSVIDYVKKYGVYWKDDLNMQTLINVVENMK